MTAELSTVASAPVCTARAIDARGPRFGAGLTSAVLVAALLLVGTPAGTAVLAWQTTVFALGAIVGLRAQPYGWIYRTFVRPRLRGPVVLEDAAPPRFAQAVGLLFTAVALAASIAGLTAVAVVAIAFALGAALLNAVLGVCLGCEFYLIGRRILARQ
jgi:hypothetical protein